MEKKDIDKTEYLQINFQNLPTFRPRSNSFKDRRISFVNMFIRSHSWKATTMYGVLSSTGTLAIISIIFISSGNFSKISSNVPFI